MNCDVDFFCRCTFADRHMNNSNHPIIIVGAGLAGLSVAVRLIRRGENVIVYDNGINHSSIIAAGMINPLVFRRMTKSWRVDDCLKSLNSFYADLETFGGKRFHHPIQIRRMFSSKQEREYWEEKQHLDAFKPYMTELSEEDNNYSNAINEFGSGRVKNASYVDTGVFLEVAKSFVQSEATLREESFDPSKISGDVYKNERFKAVIFCQGYLGADNPFFGYLPLQQTKGETLTIKSESLPENESVNRKCFVLPLGNKTFKVGSTYVWNTPLPEVSEEGRTTILENLSYLTDETVEVIDQGAGVRPTTPDRRAMIGAHPKKENIFIFNGLGTKGYMLAPLLSEEFIAFLLDGKPLHPEVEAERFKAKHWSEN